MFEQPRTDPQTNTLNQYFVGMYEDQSYCGEFALWVDVAQGFKVLIAGAPCFSSNRLLQVTTGACNPDLKVWSGRFLPVRGDQPVWESSEDFQINPHCILAF